VPRPAAPTYAPRVRDIETIDSELRWVAALRCAARERGGPMPSIDVADALLDERRELTEVCEPDRPSPRFIIVRAAPDPPPLSMAARTMSDDLATNGPG
jgi:hypothetical protein